MTKSSEIYLNLELTSINELIKKFILNDTDDDSNLLERLRLSYEVFITLILNNLAPVLTTKEGEKINLSYEVNTEHSIYQFFYNEIDYISKKIVLKNDIDLIEKVYLLNSLVFNNKTLNNSIKITVLSNDLFITQNYPTTLNLLFFKSDNFSKIIFDRFTCYKNLLLCDEYKNQSLPFKFAQEDKTLIFFVDFIIKIYIKENKFSEVFSFLYEELKSYNEKKYHVSYDLINEYVFSLFIKLISFNHLFQLEPNKNINAFFSKYKNNFTEDKVKQFEDSLMFNLSRFDIDKFHLNIKEIENDSLNPINKTEIYFIIPFELIKGKNNQIIYSNMTITFEKVINLFSDPIYNFFDFSPFKPFIGDIAFPIHIFSDAYPLIEQSTIVTFQIEGNLMPNYSNYEIKYWESISGSTFNSYKKYAFDKLIEISDSNPDFIPFNFKTNELNPNIISNIFVRFLDNNENVIDNQIDLFTSNTSYSKFKQRYLSKLNSLNLEFGYESFRKLLIESKINNNRDLLNFIFSLTTVAIKEAVENNGIYKLLWNNNLPLNETDIQPLLYTYLEIHCDIKGINISKEPEISNGKLDFLFSYTDKTNELLKVCMEVKKAHHKNLIEGLTLQLPQYMKASRTKNGIFMVLWFKGTSFNDPPEYNTIEDLNLFLKENLPLDLDIKIIIIDCSKPVVPSKMRKNTF